MSELRAVERALREERDRTAAIMAAMGEGFMVTVDGRITDVNEAISALTGFSREELLGTVPPWPFWPPELADDYGQISQRISADRGGTFEAQLMRKDGSRFEAEITAHVALQPDGSLLGWVSTVRDVSERRRYEAELERLATHDPLTGLANHRLFHQRLGEEMAIAIRHDRPLSVAILDLDHFKQINDRFGHVVGDTALVTVAARLAGVVRDGELLARVGGEEFAWILPDADADGVFAAAERARQAIGDRPLPGAGRVTISIGAAARGRGREAPALYEQADEALYLAKRHGRDRTIIWDSANAPVVRSQSADG